jgi:archaellum component FlaC
MKRITYLLVAAVIFISACETKTKKENTALKERVTELENENKEFRAKHKKLNTTVQDYRKFLGEINNNLKEIDISSSAVSDLSTEIKKGASIEDEVRIRMQTVMQLIENSKYKILALDNRLRELRQQAGDQSEEIMKLESELGHAIMDLMDKEREYLEMTAKMENMYEEQMAITEELRSILNRAFYHIGTSRELTDKGIIEKEGGFVGLGRVKVLSANLPDSIFKETNKASFDSLLVKAEKMELITSHPNDSYQISKKGEKQRLIVKDKEAFWSLGNYLVIQVK